MYSFGGWNVLDVDLGQLTVWGQGNDDFGRFDACGFGDSLHEQFPQLLSGKGVCFGVCFGISCVLPSGLLELFLPDPILALSGLEQLSITPFLGFLEVVLGLS